jgi:hypothetical protein
MRKRRLIGVLIFAVPALLAATTLVVAGDGGRNNRFNSNKLNGYQEVSTTGALSTTGNGGFTAELDGDVIHYSLTFGELEGAVTQAHIHFGRRGVNGGIIAWLCGTTANPGPAGTRVCPPAGGTVTGDIGMAQVIGPAGQGIAATQFAEAVAALRAGAVYANVHSALYPGGEIRGQVNEKGAKDADKLGKDDDED